MSSDLPKFQDWGIAAVWLLRGVVYADDERVWNVVLSNVSALESYFARIGLRLVVDESEGMSYLRQLEEDELDDGYEALPRLFRTSRLSYGQTILCIVLRDEFRRFEEEDLHNERCVVDQSVLLDHWRAFHPNHGDEVREEREMLTALRRLEDYAFIRRFSEDPPCWEIRRILKARVTAEHLESLRDQVQDAVERRTSERN